MTPFSLDDSVAHFNLGSLYLRMNRPDEAVRALSASLRLHPVALAYVRLGYALKMLGHTDHALQAFAEALRLEPTNQLALDELNRLRGVADFVRNPAGGWPSRAVRETNADPTSLGNALCGVP